MKSSRGCSLDFLMTGATTIAGFALGGMFGGLFVGSVSVAVIGHASVLLARDPIPRLPCDGDSWVVYTNRWKPAPTLAVRRVAPPPSVVPPLVLEMTNGALKNKRGRAPAAALIVLNSLGSYRLVNSMPSTIAERPDVSSASRRRASGSSRPDFARPADRRAFFSLADRPARSRNSRPRRGRRNGSALSSSPPPRGRRAAATAGRSASTRTSRRKRAARPRRRAPPPRRRHRRGARRSRGRRRAGRGRGK